MPNLIEIIKQAAIEAVEASSPCKILFGTVTSLPLKIKIDQKLTLESEHLILTTNTQNLIINDQVILISVQGGQQYIVLDKVVVT